MKTSEQHFTNLTLLAMRPATIEVYSSAVRSLTTFFERTPDTVTKTNLKYCFAQLIQTHYWSTIKLDRNR